jgi:serine/threonine protein kinase
MFLQKYLIQEMPKRSHDEAVSLPKAENQSFLIDWSQHGSVEIPTKFQEFERYCRDMSQSACGLDEHNDDVSNDRNSINKGAFGRVFAYKAYEPGTVIKLFNEKNKANDMLREAAMCALNFKDDDAKYIIRTLSCVKLYSIDNSVFRYGLKMENGGDDMYTFMTNNGMTFSNPLHASVMDTFIEQLLRGVSFLHRNQIYHNDLKPENVLVCVNDDKYKKGLEKIENILDKVVLKICDFGLAHCAKWVTMDKHFGSLVRNPHTKKYNFFGTEIYLPPKDLAMDSLAFFRDEWALGCLFFLICYGIPLCASSTKHAVVANVFNKTYMYLADIYALVPNLKYEPIMQGFLSKNPIKAEDAAEQFLKIK